MYEAFFGKLQQGTFVEVGAFDGYNYSNTSCLAHMDWRGIYIEPVPEFADLCRSRYEAFSNIQVLNLAVGAEKSNLCLTIGGPLTTASDRLRNEYDEIPWAANAFQDRRQISVPQERLDDVLSSTHVNPGFELLVVDVEGHEFDVFAGFNLNLWRPKMIIVELSDLHPDLRSSRREYWTLYRHLIASHYLPVYKDSVNTVLIDQNAVDYKLS